MGFFGAAFDIFLKISCNSWTLFLDSAIFFDSRLFCIQNDFFFVEGERGGRMLDFFSVLDLSIYDRKFFIR